MKVLTKETKELVDKYIQAQETIETFHDRVRKIIVDIFKTEPYPDEIYRVELDGKKDNLVHAFYEYGDGYGREEVKFPFVWLNEGFDYKADYKRRLNVIKERKRRLAKARKEQKEAAKEDRERKEYERLKAKFEGE